MRVRRPLCVLLTLGTLASACSSGSAARHPITTTTTALSTLPTVPTTATTPTTSTTATTTAPAANLFQQLGTGREQTSAFQVPSDWELAWAFDCGAAGKGTGGFAILIGTQFGGATADHPIAQHGVHGAGVEQYHVGGNVFLSVDTLCPWGVAALPARTTVAPFGVWTGVKPSRVQFSGDAGDVLDHITWTTWGPTSAEGHGSWEYDDCIPNCAEGKTTAVPATLTLSQPVDSQFTKIVEVTSGPHGQTQTFDLPDWFFTASA